MESTTGIFASIMARCGLAENAVKRQPTNQPTFRINMFRLLALNSLRKMLNILSLGLSTTFSEKSVDSLQMGVMNDTANKNEMNS